MGLRCETSNQNHEAVIMGGTISTTGRIQGEARSYGRAPTLSRVGNVGSSTKERLQEDGIWKEELHDTREA